MRINIEPQPVQDTQRDDLIDTLIAISVVAKHLASKLTEKKEENDVKNERVVAGS